MVPSVRPAPVRGGFLYQEVEQSVVGRGHGPSEARLARVFRLLVNKQEGLLQEVFGEGHWSDLLSVGVMRPIASEVEIWLESPPIVWLKSIEEHARHSAGYISQARLLPPVRCKEDSEEDGRLAAGIGSETELNVANLAAIERPCCLRDLIAKLALVNETTGDCRHVFIIARFRAGDQVV